MLHQLIGRQVAGWRGHRMSQRELAVEAGISLGGGGRDEDAVVALMRAEEVCPQWVRMRPTVRDTVRVALYRIRRRALSAAPLRRAARMVDLDTDCGLLWSR